MEILLTKENITFALAVFGSVGTLLSWICTICANRKNIGVQISKAYFCNNTVLTHIIIDNKSRLPITITQISLISDKSNYACFNIQTRIYNGVTKQNDVILDTKTIISPKFPIEIGSLGGTSCYPFFELPPEDFEKLSTDLTLQFHTNRGMIKKKKLSFQRVGSPGEMCQPCT